ncbi:aldo-keto reductase 1B-like [Rhynchophorus ferrugineus]|uniref:aldo-keto reductase 1B-like n=1 Tax=Rhynchophorus ferrugineus TaxID=354439 RepID=UPI003FCDF550
MASCVPKVTLNNGVSIPAIGLGTWRANKEDVKEAIKHAIDTGYRNFDCALFYGNEEGVGEGIRAKIAEGVIKRQDVFVASKLWCNSMRPDLVESTIKRSLSNFGFDYLDLYLIHWPTAFAEGDILSPKDDKGDTVFSDVDYVDTWKAMEAVCKKGLTRCIGVCNFNINQLKRILDVAEIIPVTNQVELHPYLTQTDLVEFCKRSNIVITAYSPLGSPDRPWAKPSEPILIENKTIIDLSKKYKATPAQIVLRYLTQKGVVPIPKSSNEKRIAENFDIFNFELNIKDMRVMDGLDCNMRYHPFHDGMGHKHYPFKELQ